MFTLLLSMLCGVGFGYAAQRGSICAVRSVAELIDKGSGRQLAAAARCSLWVVAVAVPLVWLDPAAHLAPRHAASLAALLGGAVFGVGAALNGSCSFGTIIGLGAGDLSYLATLAGTALGFALQLSAGPIPPAALGPSLLQLPSHGGLLLIAAAWALCARELVLIGIRPRRRRRWSPERAAALMGMTGGVLYALNGSWAWTVSLQRSVAAMADAPAGEPRLLLIFAACVAGAAWGARRRLRLRLNLAAWPVRLAGGTVMGAGAAYVPGGNDALLLHGAPALSPHVLVAWPALLAGVAAALVTARLARGLRLGPERRRASGARR